MEEWLFTNLNEQDFLYESCPRTMTHLTIGPTDGFELYRPLTRVSSDSGSEMGMTRVSKDSDNARRTCASNSLKLVVPR